MNNSDDLEKFGSQTHTLPEHFQVHKKIELFANDNARVSEDLVELYQKGLSLLDISRQTGKAKNTIAGILRKSGIALRPKSQVSISKAIKEKGKGSIRPYYGFCYFQGAVVPDQREFENLLKIHELWKSGSNPNRIADILNAKKIPARSASAWNRNSVVNIITRFKNKNVILLKGGRYELR